MRTSPDIPLSADEIDELDRFLVEELDTMDISTLDGFFTALLCGPKMFMPGEWMPWVWDPENGRAPPEFKDEREARRIMGLLTRHMNDVAMTLHDAPDTYHPLLMEYFDDDDETTGSALSLHEWSWGFLMGVDLDRDGWQPLFDENPEWTEVFVEGLDIADDADEQGGEGEGKSGSDSPRGETGPEQKHGELMPEEKHDALTLEEQRDLAAELAVTVPTIYAFWRKRRDADAKTGTAPRVIKREPVRNPEKVGRNDPCPCGSGRKFKQCHGAAGATVH